MQPTGGTRWLVPLLSLWIAAVACAQNQPTPQENTASTRAPLVATNAAEKLFLELGSVGLDPARVFHARNVSLDRPGFFDHLG